MKYNYFITTLLILMLGFILPAKVQAEALTLSYMDPVEDHLQLEPLRRLNPPPSAGIADLVALVFNFDNSTGEYEIILTASQEYPFVGFVIINIGLFNPDTGTTAQDPAFFRDVLNDFSLDTPTTTIRLTGSDPKLLTWQEGDQVAPCHGLTFEELGPCQGSLGLPDGITGFGTGSINEPGPSTPSGTGRDGFRTALPAIIIRSIEIDIKPDSDPNTVNPKSMGGIPVAILGSVDFDAMQVDSSTVEFGPDKASPVHDGHVENVNGDDFTDMVFHFKVRGAGIVCGVTDMTLTGETFGGDSITGTDAVNTVGCK